VNRSEWDSCRDPTLMIRWVRDRATPRKHRLFRCASVRRLSHVLEEYGLQWRVAVDSAEQAADGTPEGSSTHSASDWWAYGGEEGPALARGFLKCLEGSPTWSAVQDMIAATARLMEARAQRWSRAGRSGRFPTRRPADEAWAAGAWRTQADLIRDLFGHLFHDDPTWADRLERRHEVEPIARAIYDGHSFADVPILGDALEDAGCTDEEVLAHCRQGGEHARGCWVLDAILGRQ
jgi:hypothetical protein